MPESFISDCLKFVCSVRLPLKLPKKPSSFWKAKMKRLTEQDLKKPGFVGTRQSSAGPAWGLLIWMMCQKSWANIGEATLESLKERTAKATCSQWRRWTLLWRDIWKKAFICTVVKGKQKRRSWKKTLQQKTNLQQGLWQETQFTLWRGEGQQ